VNAYALNLAFTGALNTYNSPATGAFRNSFTGGTQGGIPEPSSAMLLMELGQSEALSNPIPFLPIFGYPNAYVMTAYPAPLRELWAPYIMKITGNCVVTNQVDRTLLPHNEGFVIGRADGSAKHYNGRAFLAMCPTRADFTVTYSGWACGPTDGGRFVNAAPTWRGEWPLWGLN
jgi:hypothetical protein